MVEGLDRLIMNTSFPAIDHLAYPWYGRLGKKLPEVGAPQGHGARVTYIYTCRALCGHESSRAKFQTKRFRRTNTRGARNCKQDLLVGTWN